MGVFKAPCLAVVDQVQAAGEPVVVTERGAPIVATVSVKSGENGLFGFVTGKVRNAGDMESLIPVE